MQESQTAQRWRLARYLRKDRAGEGLSLCIGCRAGRWRSCISMARSFHAVRMSLTTPGQRPGRYSHYDRHDAHCRGRGAMGPLFGTAFLRAGKVAAGNETSGRPISPPCSRLPRKASCSAEKHRWATKPSGRDPSAAVAAQQAAAAGAGLAQTVQAAAAGALRESRQQRTCCRSDAPAGWENAPAATGCRSDVSCNDSTHGRQRRRQDDMKITRVRSYVIQIRGDTICQSSLPRA